MAAATDWLGQLVCLVALVGVKLGVSRGKQLANE
jgi:hypothetical protein